VNLLTWCLNGDLLSSKDVRGLLLLQLGRHLHDLGHTSLAAQVNSTPNKLSLANSDSKTSSEKSEKAERSSRPTC